MLRVQYASVFSGLLGRSTSEKKAELLRRFFQIANFFVLSLAQLHRRSIIAFKCTENR